MKCLILILSLTSLAHAGEPDNRRSTYAGLIQLAQQPPRSAPIAAPVGDPFAEPGKPTKPVASAEKPSLPPVEPKAMPVKADGSTKTCDVVFKAGDLTKFLVYRDGKLVSGSTAKLMMVFDAAGPKPIARVSVVRKVLDVERSATFDWEIKSVQTLDASGFESRIQQALEGE